MRVSIERLRFWMLAMAILLVAGVAAFLGYSRWRMHRAVGELPGKLGISIEQSTKGFTFSKSEGGHTLFTLHAARTIQYKKGGRAELHDVSIVLYNPSGEAVDRIHGNEFAYDPAAGLVSANGAVDIDLQGPVASHAAGSLAASEAAGGHDAIHVRTSGLVFDQKTGIASTTGPIQFQVSGTEGSAVGASFDSRSGVLTIEHDMSLKANPRGNPLDVEARHAVFDRTSRQFHLIDARVNYRGSQSSSAQATVFFRPDGSAIRADASGEVSMRSGDRWMNADKATVEMDAQNHPKTLMMEGNLAFRSHDATRQLHGSASAGTVHFGPKGYARQAQFRGGVAMFDREGPGNGRSSRELHTDQMTVNFHQTARGSEASTIVAEGGAVIQMADAARKGKTTIRADTLEASLKDGSILTRLEGSGNTRLTEIAPDGARQISSGDRLEMRFAPSVSSARSLSRQPARGNSVRQRSQTQLVTQPVIQSVIQSAEQVGNVVLVNEPPQPKGTAKATNSTTTITAGRATFEAAGQIVRFFGTPRIHNSSGDLSARNIVFDRGSGDAQAIGEVQAVYRLPKATPGTGFSGAGPVNVIADHASFNHSKNLTTFFGNARQNARFWQGADSISAPVIELSRQKHQLIASGGGANRVLAVLTGPISPPGASAKKGKPSASSAALSSTFEIRSTSVLYLAAEQKAIFRGGVTASGGPGSMKASRMTIFFHPSGTKSPAAVKSAGSGHSGAAAHPGAEVERIVAEGDVRVAEPGRTATGSKLTYYAADGRFILTGSRRKPPRLVDEAHGSVTGESLIFNNRDDSVIVRGGSSRAITETRTGR